MTRKTVYLYSNRGIAAEDIDDFDTSDVFVRCGIFIPSITNSFETAKKSATRSPSLDEALMIRSKSASGF